MMPAWLERRALWLLVPPIVLCSLDYGLTLYGQSEEYWRGNYQVVNEMSPSFAHYLAIHPLASVAAAFVWITVFSAVVLLVPEGMALVISVAIVIGHMEGAASWLAYRFHAYQACNALSLGVAVLIVVAFKRGQNTDGSAAFDWQRTGLPEGAQWLLIAVLVVLPTWWFLIPH